MSAATVQRPIARPSLHIEIILFTALLALANWPLLIGAVARGLVFLPGEVAAGEWWRLLTHPFVHVSWYHLLLDGAAFLLLWHGLEERRRTGRLLFLAASAAGSLLVTLCAAPTVAVTGLCGLSGIAHGLTAVSALEWITSPRGNASLRRIGWIALAAVTVKSALEAGTGQCFFGFLHFGLLGSPVAVCHAGGVIGGATAFLGWRRAGRLLEPANNSGTATTPCGSILPPHN